MMEREESSQATFILARSTNDFGRTIVSLASSEQGQDRDFQRHWLVIDRIEKEKEDAR